MELYHVGWGNVDIVFMAKDRMAPFHWAFEAVGYAYEALDREQADAAMLRDLHMVHNDAV